MRKFFEGHSLVGVVIILSAFVLAVLLRFYDLSSQSPWTDEIATWWYVRHLDQVFVRESHTPLFYGLIRIFLGNDPTISAIRHFVASVSVIHLLEFFFLGQLALSKRAFLAFWVFACLNPADIIHARMARQYAWLLEGVLVYFLLWRIRAPWYLKMLNVTFMSFIHIFAIIPILALGAWDLYKERKGKDIILAFASVIPVCLYYSIRFLEFGQTKVLSNVSWVKSSLYSFLWATLVQFLGDSFPRLVFYPVSPVLAFCVFLASLAVIFYYRRPSAWTFLFISIVSVVVIEMAAPWVNFHVNRYVLYLSGLWIFALAEALGETKYQIFYPVLCLPLVYVMIFNPFLLIPWEREKVEEWREFVRNENRQQIVECVNDYQSEYFKLGHQGGCALQISTINLRKPFLFFDLNGTDTYVTAPFLKYMQVVKYVPLNFSGVIVKFAPDEDLTKVVLKKTAKRGKKGNQRK